MRTLHRMRTGRRLLRRVLASAVLSSLLAPKNDTSLDYRERTISRTEVAILRYRLIPAEAPHVRADEQASSRAWIASREWYELGVRR